MARKKRLRMHRSSDTSPNEGPVLGREDLRMARLARLESKAKEPERREEGNSQQPEKENKLKREDIKEMERILVLEWCDERHNSAATLVGRARRLTKILSNALTGEDKYRKLRYNNPVVQREILACPPTEKLLRAVGWTSKVETNERFLVFSHPVDSKEVQLSERLIERLSEVQRKEQLRCDLTDQKKMEEQERLERARLLLNDDHVDRKEKQQRMEADMKAKEEADKKAKEEADKKAKEEADKKAKEEADKKAKEEADKKAKNKSNEEPR